jgi:hypothetical protein
VVSWCHRAQCVRCSLELWLPADHLYVNAVNDQMERGTHHLDTEVTHVLITRFNLPSKGAEAHVRVRDGWLHDRLRLFESFCVPSVEAQIEKNFTWIVYLDPSSPRWLLDRIDCLSAGGLFAPHFYESVPRETLLSNIESMTGGPTRYLLTTNLDNDDALAIDFTRRVRRASRADSRVGIYIDSGLILNGDALYARRDRHNAFCSVQESWRDAVTCWCTPHNKLHHIMPVLEVSGGAPGWLQIVHGGNVSNRVRGKRVSPLPYRAQFPAILDTVDVPTSADLARDRYIHQPRRTMYEIARTTTKWFVLKVGGQRGFESTKQSIESARSKLFHHKSSK